MADQEDGESRALSPWGGVDLSGEDVIVEKGHSDPMSQDAFVQWFTDSFGATLGIKEALQQAAFMLCCDVISQDLAKSTLRLRERISPKTSRIVMPNEHPIAAFLAMEPNRRHTWYEFTEMMALWACLTQNAYAAVIRNRMDDPIEILPFQSGRVRELVEGRDVFYEVTASTMQEQALLGGLMARFPEANMIHVRGRMLDGMDGYSTMWVGRTTLETAKVMEEYRNKLFAEEGQMRGVFTRDAALDILPEDAFLRMRSQFRDLMTRFRKIAEPIVLEGGMKFDPIAANPEEAQLVEQFDQQINQMCRLLRVPPHKVFHIDESKYCIPGGESVFTDCGPIPMSDVTEGTMVWSRDDDGHAVLAPVLRKVSSGVDRVLKIGTRQRTLRCTAGHRVLARRKTIEIVQNRRDRPGRGAVQNHRKAFWTTEYVRAGELKVGDIIIMPLGLPDQGGQIAPTRVATVPFMEVVGFYLGDGNITYDKGRPMAVCLARAPDAPYMDAYRSAVTGEFSRSRSIKGGEKTLIPVHICEQKYTSSISSVEMAREFVDLGLAGYSETKRVPQWVFGLSHELKAAILRGYVDADGSVDKKGRISFMACQRGLLEDMRHLCMSIGVPTTNLIRYIANARTPQGTEYRQVCWRFTCSDPGANLRIGSHTPVYMERMLAGKPFSEKEGKYPKRGGRGFSEPHFAMTRIASIEDDGEEEVFDLQVAGTESFIASGVVVHNSNLETMEKAYVGDTLVPVAERFEHRFARALLSRKDRLRLFFEFDRDEMTLKDTKAETERVIKAVERGIITLDEARARLGLNELPNGAGKVRTIPANMNVVDETNTVLIGANDGAEAVEDEESDTEEDENAARDLRLIVGNRR